MQSRCIYTCAKLQKAPYQLGRIVNKVMNDNVTKKNRSKQSHNATAKIISSFSFNSNNSIPTHVNRRVIALNKLFMKYITDLISTEEIGSKLVGKGIEITHVKVAPDFKMVYVYWYAETQMDGIENLLKNCAGQLQHELSQLRIIGIVPPLCFIRNKRYNAEKEIERILEKVDFGEDYVPTDPASSTTVPFVYSTLSDKVKAQLLQIEKEDNIVEEEFYEISIPEMKQNIMGFDHFAVMKKIKDSLSKSKMVQTQQVTSTEEQIILENEMNNNTTIPKESGFLLNENDTAVFAAFLKKRAMQEKQKQRAISLLEAKKEAEQELYMALRESYEDLNDEINLDDEYTDNHDNIESYK